MSYRELEIYQLSKSLAIEVHKMTLLLPKFELYEEGSQVRRSSKAVASMIVEGYGRKRYIADYVKHLVYALTECDETILHLEFLYETGSYKEKAVVDQYIASYDLLSKKINRFVSTIKKSPNKHNNNLPPPDDQSVSEDLNDYRL
jgi:four helix bundle protein